MFGKKNWKKAARGFAALLGVCCLGILPMQSAAATEWTMQTPGVYKMLDGSTLSGVFARGVDTSHWQGEVDWAKAAQDDVDFVMLGTRYKGQIDPRFAYNARNAVKNGIKLGVYIYSYATTVEMAEAEADFVLDLIKDYPISYPVAFDVEDANTQGKLPKEELTAIIRAFTDKIAEAGYYPMVYANDYWIANKLDMSAIKDLDIWVARYNTKHVYATPAMWQATDTGRVQGFQGNVDIDFQYKDFSSLIPANTWRNIGDKRYYYQDYVMQKSSWIYDGKHHYYMNEEGQASKGWFVEDNKYYYLDGTDGRMAVAWKQINNRWYYFAPSGYLKNGWIQDKGLWYYADKEGVMQTGWIELGGERYYLGADGAMRTGFQELGGKTYFLQESGVLAKSWIHTADTWYFADGEGVVQTGWLKDKGSWYYLDSAGRMQSGWQDIGGQRYYLNASGVMQSGATNINDIWYYFEENGALARNSSIEYEGKIYDVNEQGQMIERKVEESGGTDLQAPSAETTSPSGELSKSAPSTGDSSSKLQGPGV